MSTLDHIATRIAPKFGVSAEVIAKRLRVEKLWPPAETQQLTEDNRYAQR